MPCGARVPQVTLLAKKTTRGVTELSVSDPLDFARVFIHCGGTAEFVSRALITLDARPTDPNKKFLMAAVSIKPSRSWPPQPRDVAQGKVPGYSDGPCVCDRLRHLRLKRRAPLGLTDLANADEN
jgi:hypothetical protein